jgi:hypothetical protein
MPVATKRLSAVLRKACLVVALAASANACILVDERGVPVPGPGAKSASGDAVICHKGKKTMTLPRNAVQAHLDHGDRYGAC